MKRAFIIMFVIVSVIFATSNHTIVIDGINSGWATDEDFIDVSNADFFYLTWDADYIYLGISDAEADYGNMATFVYFDTDPSGGNGTTDAYAWSNNIVTPFPADVVVVWKNSVGSDYIEIMEWNGSLWQKAASANSSSLNNGNYVVDFSVTDGNDYREARIKRSCLGSPSEIKICSFTEQQWSSYWRYFAWPSSGWTDGNRTNGQTISHYRGYELTGNISPDATGAYDGVLPVELTSFTGSLVNGAVELNWETATEVNNAGFEVERSTDRENFTKLAFVPGNGTTNSPRYYSYTDSNLPDASSVTYRLKQIDNDGTYEYSKTVTVDISKVTGVKEEPVKYKFELAQNYPNPFNPSTAIKFTVAETADASLKIYDAIGNEVAEIFNGKAEAGRQYNINFDASNLTSGVYFYQLTSQNNIQVKKMLLIK